MGGATMIEKRGATLEVRARGRRLEGIVAPFNVETRIGSSVEVIRPGAFAASLASGGDIIAMVDHDAGRVLARTRSGTLRLAETAAGLAFDLDVPDTTAGRDVLALAERGDIGGASFGFRATDEAWNGNRRELRAVQLLEVSIVQAWPAYDATSVHARALAAYNLARPLTALGARLRLLEVRGA